MSQHASFRQGRSALTSNKTVLKRFERIELLKRRGQWQEGQSVLGLRKTKPE
jgi:small basic protein (TIGR04137 family)